jgi:hypothetical protein
MNPSTLKTGLHHGRWLPLLLTAALLPACGSAPPVESASGALESASEPLETSAGIVAATSRSAIFRNGVTPSSNSARHSSPPVQTDSVNDVSYHGGKVLTDVDVVAIYWDTSVSWLIYNNMPSFYAAVVDSPYMDLLVEYDTPTQPICRGSFAGTVTLYPANTANHLSDADIRHELATEIDAGDIDPQPDENTLYMVHFPPSKHITGPPGVGESCVDFCAYHDSFEHNGRSIRYAVLPDLGPSSDCDGVCGDGTTLQNETSTASHELAEAVTDPDPDPLANAAWTSITAGEIGDSCNQDQRTLPGTSWTVQAVWSNEEQACIVSGGSVRAPIVDNITPTSGPYNTSDGVLVTGSCFANPIIDVVKNGHDVLGSTQSPGRTSMTVILPPSPDGAPGDAWVLFSNSGHPGLSVSSFNYFYVGPLNVSISPASGSMFGGTAVTISGSGFVPGETQVSFGGTPATYVDCSATSCLVYAPAHVHGTVPVLVTASGTSVPSSNDFTFLGPTITSVTPNTGPISGGTSVAVVGTNMIDSSRSGLITTATIGGITLDNIACDRQGLYDAACTLTTPAVASLPAAPVDIRITVKDPFGADIKTPIDAADGFTYTQLPAVSQLVFNGWAGGGATVTGTVVLNGLAPTGGVVVSLELAAGSPSGVINFPSTVNVADGELSADFPVLIVNQDFWGPVSVVASYAVSSAIGTLNVTATPPPTLSAIGQLCGAQTFMETITLAEPAPPGGGLVALSTNNAVAAVPPTVIVPAGSTTATFTITTATTAATQNVQLSADYYGIAANPVSFSVLPAAAVAVTVAPSIVTGGQSATGTVTLCVPAPANSSVTLGSNNIYATVPASVPIGGASTASFSVTTFKPLANQVATLAATYQGASATGTLRILAPPHCSSGQTLCTCPDGSHACLTTAQQCLNFCRGR